jgi:hypothetical protein
MTPMYDALVQHGLDRARIAIHEAAHAALARLHGFHPDSVNVSPDAPHLFSERCRGYLQVRSRQGSDDPLDLWQNSVISAGGHVADLWFYRDIGAGVALRDAQEYLDFAGHGFGEGDARHIVEHARRLFGVIVADEVLIAFALDAVEEAKRLLQPVWPNVIGIAEKFIEAASAMESIEPQPRDDAGVQETRTYEHYRKCTAKTGG